MLKLLIANHKGGVGKSLVATNLTTYYASQGYKTALLDCDIQKSAVSWSRRRGEFSNTISVQSPHGQHAKMRSWAFYMPPDSQRLIVDSAGGLEGFTLKDLVSRVNVVLVPLTPSQMDFDVTEGFLTQLNNCNEVRSKKVRVGLVLNRVRAKTNACSQIMTMLDSLNHPLITQIRDRQIYVFAAGVGKGIFEMRSPLARTAQKEWRPLIDWIEQRHREIA